jgi:diguanylate cyclase (GGDEF)-like protein/PAS domain S-box-containing protein
MITDHVYRPARSRERAMAELFAGVPAQFDGKLVRSFHDVFSADAESLLRDVSGHWLTALAGYAGDVTWGFRTPLAESDETEEISHRFEARLIDNMHDGVVFVDRDLQIFRWNSGAERLTGLAAAATSGRRWLPSLLDMRSEKGRQIPDSECPVALAVQSGVESLTRMSIAGRSGRDLAVNVHAVPVQKRDGVVLGATVFLQDASPEASLEQRCQALQDQATRDPLTRLANRAEFDRLHKLFIDVHAESGLAFSMIISDIDHFKHVNDVYGHQAGDDALRSYAALLKGMCRSGDVVARYGGEEFVILCADCNNASAAERAEQIRRKLADFPQPVLGNRGITASFGVTELQPGDTPETMLRRADRALLQAKDQGRNQVVQLGSGMVEIEKRRRWWPFRTARSSSLIDSRLVTIVPLDVAVEKLRGFIADHSAKITSTGDDHLVMEVSGEKAGRFRRGDDRPVPFVIELQFGEERVQRANTQGLAAGEYVQTAAHVVVRPKRDRDGRRDQAAERARHILLSMKSYLMAKEETDAAHSSTSCVAFPDGDLEA